MPAVSARAVTSRGSCQVLFRRLANSSLRIWRECRVRNGAAKKIEHFFKFKRAILRRHVGLRARFFSAFRLEVAAERGLAFHVGARLQIGRHLLEHLYVGLDRLNGQMA